MTPGARLQATIELLDEIAAAPRPADAVVSAFFRQRRYIGSKDRAAVAEGVYAILRHWARLHWWLERSGAEADARTLVLANQVLARGKSAESLIELFSGGPYAPATLSDGERRLLKALDTHTLDHPKQPEAVQGEVPDWAEPSLRAVLADRFAAEMQAMLQPAPLDLRVNPLKATRERVRAALAKEGVEAEETRLSPLGLRVHGRPPVGSLAAFRDGWLEIQDEGSQLVALLADAQPGHQVVDFCAGAGGKTLAIAARMENKGRVIATDVLDRRLERARERFRRAGLHNIETRALSSERDPWVKRHKGRFDRVVVDAPCSGTGTWRRNPDSRWRPLGPGLSELVPLQREILDSASRLVRPGGRLVYATCSLLAEENEGQVAAFLAAHPDFRLVPVEAAWPAALGPAPLTGPHLALTPGRHGTDGFFAAVLERVEGTAAEASATALQEAPGTPAQEG